MDTLIISSENNILHIFNKGYSVDYTLYDSKGHNMDGGILESSKGKFERSFVEKEIINILKDRYSFTSPYTYLVGERAETLLELIEMEDYKYTQSKVNNFLSSVKEDAEKEINI